VKRWDYGKKNKGAISLFSYSNFTFGFHSIRLKKIGNMIFELECGRIFSDLLIVALLKFDVLKTRI